MALTGGTVRIVNLPDALTRLVPERIAGRASRRLLEQSLAAIRDEARARARVDRGDYRDGFRVETDAGLLTTRGRVVNDAPHAAAAHFGRGPGRMPPEAPIADWAARHGFPAEAVYPIRRKIGREGTTGDFALAKAVDATRGRIPGFVADAARDIERSAGGG